jgi:hypothetical protein
VTQVISRVLIAICLSAVCWLICTAQSKPRATDRAGKVNEVISWLPADTETIFVASTQFVMPPFKQPETEQGNEPSLQELLRPLDRFETKKGLLQNYLKGERIELTVEGSRHFSPPVGSFGAMPYEGCEIAVLAKATSGRETSFMKAAGSAALRTDGIAGQNVVVFREKIDDETWTTFVSFPRPDLVLACTNRDYLTEVLHRIGGKGGIRALPDTLAEWKFVNTNASCWGLRHYDKTQAERDPTSPFRDFNIIKLADKNAIGIVFAVDSEKRNVLRLFYFSGTKDLLGFLQKETFLLLGDGAELPIRYRLAAPGVAEIEYELGNEIPTSYFVVMLLGAFGHALYL